MREKNHSKSRKLENVEKVKGSEHFRNVYCCLNDEMNRSLDDSQPKISQSDNLQSAHISAQKHQELTDV